MAAKKRHSNSTDEEKQLIKVKAVIYHSQRHGITLTTDEALQRLEENKNKEINKNSPEYKEVKFKNYSDAAKKRWEDPNLKKVMSETVKQRWENPEYKQHMSEFTSKLSKLTSERNKKNWKDPEYRNKMLIVLQDAHKKK